ncbi:hypothetical protein P154DRAFT_617026 [Amniculicola lignicola CBS 123094]|uniref:Zn(2)-C6 fungal-type domain-containing protein n=1 Tax=Amniculicola lignicola CBS 123094 TaxID=1392246 RepID=A0A6A5WRK1_9PLEO|nr:hypothetical protein P154DRAFT_617026 [Amniculicola lignicola CBS 123094]
MELSPRSEKASRKRKQRTLLSCNTCRKRKLKCDRESPCNRCLASGHANTCAYGREFRPGSVTAREEPEKSSVSITSNALEQSSIARNKNQVNVLNQDRQDIVQTLETRVASLEAQLLAFSNAASQTSQTSTTEQSNIPGCEGEGSWTGLFKSRGYRTFAYGATSPVTIIANFPELHPFMKQVYPGSVLERLHDDIKKLEDRTRSKGACSGVLKITHLRSLFPDRATIDVLVTQYLETFETTYHILHIPSFYSSYEALWTSSPGSDSDFEAVVLAILACVLCTSTHEDTRQHPNGSAFRTKAIIWLKACEAWLKRHSNKRRTLASLQVRCLRLLALKTTCFKTKELYQEIQAHVAFMRTAGMHLDPSIRRGRCTIFEAEMRRRLWATTLEFEVQASIDRGLPSVLSNLDYTCAPPRNIDDYELKVDLERLPDSKPISTSTDTSFLYCAAQTSALRIKLCTLANSVSKDLELPEILQYEQEIRAALAALPKWTTPRAFQAWTHLDLILRQYLAILHTKIALRPRLAIDATQRYSVLTCLEASVAMIDEHTNMMAFRNYTLTCTRSDYYRAALLLCHIAYHASLNNDSFILQLITTFDASIEKALSIIEERSIRPGRGNHQYWIVSAACSLARSKRDPENADELRKQAAGRVSRLLYKILSLQDDVGEEYFATEVVLEPLQHGDGAVLANPTPPADAMTTETLSLEGFDFANTSGWMLDDFWFFNDLPPLEFAA